MKRVVTPELLDSDAGSRGEVEGSLADLRLVNRWFGGARVMELLLQQVAARTGARRLSLLDVASATGDVPRRGQERLARQGIRLDVTLLDRATSHMDRGLRYVAGNALSLPFADRSFDLVSCSLFAHHLEPLALQTFVNEGLRVARRAVLINDLRRHPLHLALVYAGLPLYRSRLTRHDAPVSIRRSYTPAEMRSLLEKTRAARVEIGHFYLFRMGVIAWKGLAEQVA
ncbi:MAG: methyltransferase domain-containing protein [Terriglobales bacterium]